MPATITADSLAEAAQNLPMPERDADLVWRIESAIPLDSLLRRKTLRAATQGREFTNEEYEEFARLTDEIEIAEAARIGLLSELATLRNVSLPEIALQLGLRRS